MFRYNVYAIPPLISGLLILTLGTYVWVKKPKSQLNFSWFLVCFTLSIWLINNFLCFSAIDNNISIIFSKIVAIGVNGIPFALLFFSLVLSKKKIAHVIKLSLFIAYALGVLSISSTGLIIANDNYSYFWGRYVKAGIYHPIYLIIWFCLFCSAILTIYKGIVLTKSPEEKQRLKYVFWACFLGGVIGPLDFIQLYGVELYPTGLLCIPVVITIITLAIFKYNLMEAGIVFKKGIVYSSVIAILTIAYLLMVLFFEWILRDIVGYSSRFISLLTAFVIAILFHPLRNHIQRFLDHYFFKGTLESLALEHERLKNELFHTEKLAYVGKLASSVVHEIKNPLTAIKTYCEHVPEKLQEGDFKSKFKQLIPSEIRRIEKTLSQLLDLSKPHQPIVSKVNLTPLIDSTLSLLENNFQQRKVKVKKEYDPEDLFIHADAEQLKQVFLNLFLNAIDAMPEGGVLTIRLKEDISNKSIILTIEDTGKGISKEDLKNLFTPFFTLKKHGIGLGLAITQEIVKNHGGKIEVESEVGRGTRFGVILPV